MDSDYITINFALSAIYLTLFSISLLYLIIRFRSCFDINKTIFMAIIELCLLINFLNMLVTMIPLWTKDSSQLPPEYLAYKNYIMSLNRWFDILNYL